VFYDGFASGSLSAEQNGFGHYRDTGSGSVRTVVDDGAGNYALRATYPANTYAEPEHNFHLADPSYEFWMEYRVHVPADWATGCGHHWFELWSDNMYSTANGVFKLFGSVGSDGSILIGGNGWYGTPNSGMSTKTTVADYIRTDNTGFLKLGQYNTLRWHVKTATGATTDDGELHHWTDNGGGQELVYAWTGARFWYPQYLLQLGHDPDSPWAGANFFIPDYQGWLTNHWAGHALKLLNDANATIFDGTVLSNTSSTLILDGDATGATKFSATVVNPYYADVTRPRILNGYLFGAITGAGRYAVSTVFHADDLTFYTNDPGWGA
jgi:hypothetical protein